MIRLNLHRINHSDDFTSGYLKYNGQFECYTLEDEKRLIKVPGETAIPAGSYDIVIREVLSPLTKRYRDKFAWFEYHLMLVGVPNFQYVYIHIGNNDDHTDGCLLVGGSINDEGFLGQSTKAFERLYKKLYESLKRGDKAKIYIQ